MCVCVWGCIRTIELPGHNSGQEFMAFFNGNNLEEFQKTKMFLGPARNNVASAWLDGWLTHMGLHVKAKWPLTMARKCMVLFRVRLFATTTTTGLCLKRP